MPETYADFEDHLLDDGHHFFVGRLPGDLHPDAAGFEAIWALHPKDYHVIQIHGRPVETPRWQQAYGADYHYTCRTNASLPLPVVVGPFRDWARRAIDDRLNGLLINWYDGPRHYIGPHHDSTRDMVPGAPIVTISLGEERVFRLTHPGRKLKRDFPAVAGTVFVMPYDTNQNAWKHGVPKSARYRGRRTSITLRAFQRQEHAPSGRSSTPEPARTPAPRRRPRAPAPGSASRCR